MKLDEAGARHHLPRAVSGISKSLFLEAVKELIDGMPEGAEGVVLGCTELQLVIGGEVPTSAETKEDRPHDLRLA